MTYCTDTDVADDFKDISFSTSTNIKSAQVTQFIVESDSLIDSYLGVRYTVPVTDASALNLLKLLSRSLVANRIKAILQVKQEDNKDANQAIRASLLSYSDVIKTLEKLSKGELSLFDAEALIATGGPFYSHNYSNDVEPVFEKDTKQW